MATIFMTAARVRVATGAEMTEENLRCLITHLREVGWEITEGEGGDAFENPEEEKQFAGDLNWGLENIELLLANLREANLREADFTKAELRPAELAEL